VGRTGVTYEEVAEAARALTEEGRRATAAAVRERLGRGSLTTIQRHLQTWREREAPVEALKKSEALQALLERMRGELERSKRMAEQMASLYRAFLGSETERLLKNLAREFARSQRELERAKASLPQLQDKGMQKVLEELRQSQERWRELAQGPFTQKWAEKLSEHLKTTKLLASPSPQQLETLRELGKQASKGLKEMERVGAELSKNLALGRSEDLVKSLSGQWAPRGAPELKPPLHARDSSLEKVLQKLEALERRLERLERGGRNGG